MTYLSTCSKTASVLPFACQKLCKDNKEELCDEYLKVDYSITCQGPNYSHLVIVAYISAAYIFALPAVSLFAHWRHRKLILTKGDGDDGLNLEVVNGVRFLFENYKPRSWYWELLKCLAFIRSHSRESRKQILHWFSLGYCRYVCSAFLLDQTHARPF